MEIKTLFLLSLGLGAFDSSGADAQFSMDTPTEFLGSITGNDSDSGLVFDQPANWRFDVFAPGGFASKNSFIVRGGHLVSKRGRKREDALLNLVWESAVPASGESLGDSSTTAYHGRDLDVVEYTISSFSADENGNTWRLGIHALHLEHEPWNFGGAPTMVLSPSIGISGSSAGTNPTTGGTLRFSNIGLDVKAAVIGIDGRTPVEGERFQVQLVVNGTPSDFQTGFLTGRDAGYFQGGIFEIEVPPGTFVTAEVRYWDTATGNTFDSASFKFVSKPWKLNVVGNPQANPPVPPQALEGMSTSFEFIPEPSTIALAVAGGAALLFQRFRRFRRFRPAHNP